MANTAVGILLLRLVLPTCLTACVVFRQNLLSFIYLLLFFYAPWVSVPNAKSMQGATGWYLQIVMICSFLTSLAQLSFQIVLLSMPPYGHFLEPCAFLERVLRHIGLVRLDGVAWADAVRALAPEALMLLVSVSVYVACTNRSSTLRRRRLSDASAASLPSTAAILPAASTGAATSAAPANAAAPDAATALHKGHSTSHFLFACGKYVVLVFLCVAGSIRPSVPGGMYFLTFIGGMTWWASGRALGRAFGGMLYIIICISVLHIIALFAVQLQWVQDLIGEGDCNYCRYLGLTRLATANCSIDPRSITYAKAEWASYVNPFILLWLYFIVTLEAQILIRKNVDSKDQISEGGSLKPPLSREISLRISRRASRWKSATRKVRECDTDEILQTESTPLMRGVSPTGNYNATANHAASGLDTGPGSLYQDPHGSVTITEINDIVQLENLGGIKESPEETSGDLFDQFINCITSVMTILNRSSYVATNIVMMAWSITYHSWLTFVLLLWASVLWMFPKQRQASLNSSPVLVMYAICLLLIQYIYGMDLTDEELPQEVQNINLKQIGFFKPAELPCKPLFAKSLYSVMFWITLRQFVYERFQKRTRSTLEDMAAPLQVTVTTATTGFGDSSSQKATPFVSKLGRIVIHFLTKYWIWVVAIMLFVIGMIGKNMTIFRIIYTALFLLFVLVFQLSYAVWRKFLYGFWITVIIYSLAILVMVYTYQFDNFDTYWARMGISATLQEDIGLEKFLTGELFVRLLIPTFFLIITVMQLHYFHRDFLKLSDISARNEISESERAEESHLPLDASENGTERGQYMKKNSFLHTMHRHMSHVEMEKAWRRFRNKVQDCIDYIWLYLEIHMYKIMLFSITLLCVHDVCAVHLILLIMAVIALSFGTTVHSLITKISSALVSLFLLSKMIYQIQYIKPDIHSVNCTFSNLESNITNYTFNNLQWIGLDKTSKELSLPELLKGYIGLIFLATILAVIIIRQQYRRQKLNLPLKRPDVIFPDVNRSNADQNLKTGIQFLVNYGFYKFGIEICFVVQVILIATRMDLYALLHCIWLCALFSLERETLSRVWRFYHIFIALTICIQYAFAVGLPPTMCIEYPWYTSETLRHLQDWAFLPDPLYSLPVYKIVADFILLILVSQQGVVFYIEKKHGASYSGGSNQDITHLIDDPHYPNPIPDFISIARSWLDIVKQRVLCTLMWVALAVMFLAGTNRVSLFSLGYLIGAFVFLWQGEDFYLRSVKVILHWWNYLLGYNIAVILCKTLLQIVGCIFLEETKKNACSIVQLFAISCIKKSGMFFPQAGDDECAVSDEVIGLFWDTTCFVFLIAMKRVYRSHYFIHIVNETKAKTILASRGAELIEQLHLNQIKAQEDQEHTMLEKIKQKMEKIKASQQKIQDTYREPSNHFEASEGNAPLAPLARSSGASSPLTPAGFHTPLDDPTPTPSPPRSRSPSPPPSLTPSAAARGSLLHAQAPTPSSAVLTVSLDGYLEPHRISFSSPPTSEALPAPGPLRRRRHALECEGEGLARAPSLDDSFPVFSPPPYGAVVGEARRRRSTLASGAGARRRSSGVGPPWMSGLATPRASLSLSSPRSHHTSGKEIWKPLKPPKYNRDAIRSGDYYMFEELEDEVCDLDEKEEVESSDENDPQYPSGKRKMSMSQFLTSALKTDLKKATDLALAGQSPQASDGSTGLEPLPESEYSPQERAAFFHVRSELYDAPLSHSSTSSRSERPVHSGEGDCPSGTRPGKPIKRNDGGEGPSDKKSPGEEEEEEKSPSVWHKISTFMKFAWAFIESAMVSMTIYLNRFSRDYRYVRKVLTIEKKMLKEKPGFGEGNRSGSGMIWEPLPGATASRVNYLDIQVGEEDSLEDSELPEFKDNVRLPGESLKVPEIRILAPSLERGLDSDGGSPSHLPSVDEIDERDFMKQSDTPALFYLVQAIWFAFIAHTDSVCYFMVFLHQVNEPTILSLPLPLMVFLWGTLSVPRPTKTFWVTMIAYTEVIVVIKCMFQFELLPWHEESITEKSPFFPPRILGIERDKHYAVYDLILLLIIFLHRFMLKSMGLWKSTHEETLELDEGEHYFMMEEGIGKRTSGTEVIQNNVEGTEDGMSLRHRFSSQRSRISTPIGHQLVMVEPLEEGVSIQALDAPDKERKLLVVKAQAQSLCQQFPKTFSMMTSKYGESVKTFFKDLLSPSKKVKADVYAYMFMCDFFNFLVIIFGFAAFGPQREDDGGVLSYLEENKVPIPFLIMLILQFALIVIDRALFLRKYILGKLVFQFGLVIGVHIWLFFVLPAVTERSFREGLTPQMWYMVKCFYLLLSAYQIRSGYPTRILGNFVCKKYNVINMVLFKGFMFVPFLFELRALMDWVWTDTSMTLWDWLKMEDIFAHIFGLKCERRMEQEYPQPRGQKKAALVKYIMGGSFLFLIIGIIWFPLVIFALGNTVGMPNIPHDMSMTLSISSYPPLYSVSVQNPSISKFSESEWNQLTATYKSNRAAQTFFSNYDYEDVAVAKFSHNASNIWTISPPDRLRLIDEIQLNKDIIFQLSWQLERKSASKSATGKASDNSRWIMDKAHDTERKEFVKIIKMDPNATNITIGNLFPKFLKFTNRDTVSPVTQLMNGKTEEEKSLRQLALKLYRGSFLNTGITEEWWGISELCSGENYDILKHLPQHSCEHLVMYVFNDKAFPETLSIISGGGIIGLYTTMVLIASNILRGYFTGLLNTIMFDDCPYVDRILQLCLDIYLVRESGELALEEDLFAKLIFLYRSPETMIKWTRPRAEDEADVEDESVAHPPPQ